MCPISVRGGKYAIYSACIKKMHKLQDTSTILCPSSKLFVPVQLWISGYRPSRQRLNIKVQTDLSVHVCCKDSHIWSHSAISANKEFPFNMQIFISSQILAISVVLCGVVISIGDWVADSWMALCSRTDSTRSTYVYQALSEWKEKAKTFSNVSRHMILYSTNSRVQYLTREGFFVVFCCCSFE